MQIKKGTQINFMHGGHGIVDEITLEVQGEPGSAWSSDAVIHYRFHGHLSQDDELTLMNSVLIGRLERGEWTIQ